MVSQCVNDTHTHTCSIIRVFLRPEVQHGGGSGRADAQTDSGPQRSEEVPGSVSLLQPAGDQRHVRLHAGRGQGLAAAQRLQRSVSDSFIRSVSWVGSSDAHFPQVDMILLWLKFLNGSVKNTFFTLSKSALFSASVLVHVPLNANELCWLRPSLPWVDKPFSWYCLL